MCHLLPFQYLTRFTDEIFSTLISVIYIVEAYSDVARAFSSTSSTLVKALLGVVCAASTYILSVGIKSIRRSVFFNKTTRNTLANFAPTIGVVVASLLARWARLTYGAATAGLPALAIPATFGTTTGRAWLVPILDLPVWARWASFLPALMATVLLYLDQNITGMMGFQFCNFSLFWDLVDSHLLLWLWLCSSFHFPFQRQ